MLIAIFLLDFYFDFYFLFFFIIDSNRYNHHCCGAVCSGANVDNIYLMLLSDTDNLLSV